MMQKIMVIRGDGIGLEIMDVILFVFDQFKIGLEYEDVDVGFVVLEKYGDLMLVVILELIVCNKVVLKSLLIILVGGGFILINVSLCCYFDLYVNVCLVYIFLNIKLCFDNVDLIIVCENIEGVYLVEGQEVLVDGEIVFFGICIICKGFECIVCYVFELVKSIGCKKVIVVYKVNIIKLILGLFLNVVCEVVVQYLDIEFQEMIVDNCCMQLVMCLEQFDVIVIINLFGDIIFDLCVGLVGGLGLVLGVNIGKDVVIFEVVYGIVLDIVGQGKVNLCVLLLVVVQMLDYIGQLENVECLCKVIVVIMEVKDLLIGDLGGIGIIMSFVKVIVSCL